MKSASITRPVLRYHGGKFRLAPRLVDVLPPHRVYTEVFGGAASVLMRKPRSYAEIYNDLDGEVVNVFRVLQNARKAARLEHLLRITPFARGEFLLGYKSGRTDIERARRTIIRSFMGFASGAVSQTKASRAGFNTRINGTMKTGFRWDSNRSGTTPAADWRNYADALPAFVERLQGVVIEQRDALEILAKMDRDDALHYVDPPYPMSVRSSDRCDAKHRYRHEMTDADHERLAEVLRAMKGMVIISSYPGAFYDSLYSGWRVLSWTGGQFCGSKNSWRSRTRTERVWLNQAAWHGSRPRLFDFDADPEEAVSA